MTRACSRRAGSRFRTRSDTEFILHAYAAHGIDGLLARLRGMFAFALVDFRARRVHLVRDRLGLKPLVYAHVGSSLAFGSTVRSVLPWLPPDRRALAPDAIDAYLAHRYIPAPRTVFADIERLPNAHRLEYELDTGKLARYRYWTPGHPAHADCAALLDQAIDLRLVADRPLGLFLSGGVDSATIAARLAAMNHSRMRAFCAAFPGSPYDESPYAHATARALGFASEDIVVPTTIRDDFPAIVAALDEPFADPSAFPTWYLARAASEQVKVVLGGDGGDELFGGYKRVAKHLRNGWRGDLRVPLPTLPDLRPKGWRKVAAELALDWEDAYALRFSGLTPNQRRFLQPAARRLPAHYWRDPDVEARPTSSGCCAGISRTTFRSTCCARPTSARWRMASSCGRRCSITASSRRSSRCRRKRASRARRSASWQRSHRTSSALAYSSARSAGSIRRFATG